MFAADGSADADLLNQTGYTQPALFAFEYALAQLWQSWGVQPDIVMGHSVGEIAAMCIAGGVSLEDGLELVAARGRLMQALPAGGVMTSVMADETRVLEAIAGAEDLVAIAAINAPGQVVISGAGATVAEVTARLSADGIKTKSLTVSHAFHSPLMKPMLAEYERVARRIRFSAPRIPFVSCVDGVLANRAVAEPEYWVRQVMEPVRFTAGTATLIAEGANAFVEVGPHPVLLGMGRQCLPEDADVEWLPSIRKDADNWSTLARSVAGLYARGAAIDWKAFDAPYVRQRLATPGYAFTPTRYWLKDLVQGTRRAVQDAPSADVAPVPGRAQHYRLDWVSARPGGTAAVQGKVHWVLLADEGGVATELARHLGSGRTTLVRAGQRFEATASGYIVNPHRADDLARLWQSLDDRDASSRRVVHLWNLDAPAGDALTLDALDGAVARGVTSVVSVAQALAGAGASAGTLWLVTRGAQQARAEGDAVAVAQAPVWGLGRTIALEHPEFWGGLIDLAYGDDAVAAAAAALGRELTHGDDEDQVVLSEAGRFVARLAPVERPAAARVALRPDGAYLVTGGVGALGLHAASWLVANGARHVVLTSRRGAVDAAGQRAIDSLTHAGAVVSVLAADVARADHVDQLLDRISSTGRPLRGILHVAGVDAPVALTAMSAADVESAAAAKVRGAWLLHDRTRHLELDLFVCFSSVASILGSQGRGHYGAANAFLDALAVERQRLGLVATTINWGPWSGGGMASAETLEQFERIGNRPLVPEDAVRALGAAAAAAESQAIVADVDWETFRPVYEARRVRPLIAALGRPASAAAPLAPAAAWVAALGRVEPSRREAELVGLLRAEVAETLGFADAASVAAERNFYEMGMDSLLMADLVSRLKGRVGFSCSALIFDHPDVRTLAAKLLPRLDLAEALSAADVPRAGSPAPPAEEVPGGIAGYSVAAEAEMLDFQADAFPERQADLVEPRWRWMFLESAQRLGVEPRMWVYRDAGRIVGQTGSIPVRIKVGAEERQTGWLVETMVLKEHRSQAVGSRLIFQAHEDQPFSLSLGQSVEAREILFRLGWKQVAPLQIARLLVRPENVLRAKLPAPAAWAAGLGLRASGTVRGLLAERSHFTVAPVDRFDDRHDRLWASVSGAMEVAVVRDASYLNWKYVDQPGQRFLRLEFANERGVTAVAVWALREPDDIYRYRRAFLVDLVAPVADAWVMHQVLSGACAAATEAGADSLLCHHISEPLTRALQKAGFQLQQPERFLLIDPSPLSSATRARALAPESWFVTQGDSDIDRPW